MGYTPNGARKRLAEAQNWRCCYCGCELGAKPKPFQSYRPNAMTLEHVVSKVDGGIKAWENLVVACHRCNNFRGTNFIGAYEFRPKWADPKMDFKIGDSDVRVP